MKKDFVILTNNKKVLDSFRDVCWVNGDFLDVLVAARDRVHTGAKLVTHPLPASIRMFYSPVRSVLLCESDEPEQGSIQVIERALETYKKTLGTRNIDRVNHDDYERIDALLLTASIDEYLNS